MVHDNPSAKANEPLPVRVHDHPIAKANERLAVQINQAARQDPTSPYAGKLVGIANGQVVVVADSWQEVMDQLRRVEQDPMKCFCLDASHDYSQVDYIWRVV